MFINKISKLKLKNILLYFIIVIFSCTLVGCDVSKANEVIINSAESVKSGFTNIFLKKADDLATSSTPNFNNPSSYIGSNDNVDIAGYDLNQLQDSFEYSNPVPEEVIIEDPEHGGELVLSMRMPQSLNPLTNLDYTVDSILKLMFESLFTIDETNLKPTPNLASDYTLTPDGKSITINMRNDIFWSNGNSITAQDVKFSLDVIGLNPDGLYYNIFNNILDYSVVNNSIVINYIEPFGFSAYDLCFPIISQAYYNQKLTVDDFENLNPMGSGSYKLLNYRLANELILEKSTNFKGTPYIETIRVIITPDMETDLYAFERNVINSIATDFSMWGNLNSTREKIASGILSNNFEYLGFNFEKEIFNNIELRKAIAYAIPKDEILNNIYLSNGSMATTPINTNSYIGLSNISEDTHIEYYNYDIKSSIDALGRANITTEQIEFNLLVNSENKERIETAELIQRRLIQVGIQINIVEKPFSEYILDLEASNFDMFLGGIDFGTKPNFISFLTEAGLGEYGLNYQNYYDMKMTLLIQNMYNAVSEYTIATASIEFQKYFAEQLPVIGIVFKNHMLATDYTVRGVKTPTLYSQYNNIHNWYIKQD